MLQHCYNCEELVEIPDSTSSVQVGLQCPICSSDLNFDLYKKCSGCGNYYIKTFPRCLECNRPEHEVEIKPKVNYVYVDSKSKYLQAISYLNDLEIIGLDTESNGLNPFVNELLLIQLGNEEIAFIFPFQFFGKLKHEKFWNEPTKTFIIQNAKFDLKFLKHKLGIEIGSIFDTMLAERVLTCGLYRRNKLENLAQKYLGIKMDKTVWEEISELNLDNLEKNISKRVKQYGAWDVQLLPQIYKIQKWQLENEGLMKIAKIEFEVSKVIADMELNGIYIDTSRWEKIISNNRSKKKNLEVKIFKIIRENNITPQQIGVPSFNLNSSQQLKKIFSCLNIQIDSTRDEELGSIDHELAKLLREHRKIEKQLSAFGESMFEFIQKKTKRIHPTYQQIGADTGRFSCSKPNLQQIPATEEYRSCFRAPPGKKIVTADYSQQELRILAWLSNDYKFIQMYKDGVDLHTQTASMMFEIPVEKVEKDHHRYIAKRINFGLAYGRGAVSLAKEIKVSVKKAEKLIQKYFSLFGNIETLLNKSALHAQKYGISKTPLGRKRYFNIPKREDPEYQKKISSIGRKGKNSPIQGCAVDMMKIALISIYIKLKNSELDAFLINTVHDELSVECAEKDAPKVAQIIEDCMVKAGEEIVKNVPIVAESCIEDYWTH